MELSAYLQGVLDLRGISLISPTEEGQKTGRKECLTLSIGDHTAITRMVHAVDHAYSSSSCVSSRTIAWNEGFLLCIRIGSLSPVLELFLVRVPEKPVPVPAIARRVLRAIDRVKLPRKLDYYVLKADAMGAMYDIQSAVSRVGSCSIPHATHKTHASAAVLYRCLENVTAQCTTPGNIALIEELEEKARKYPRVTLGAISLLKELLSNY